MLRCCPGTSEGGLEPALKARSGIASSYTLPHRYTRRRSSHGPLPHLLAVDPRTHACSDAPNGNRRGAPRPLVFSAKARTKPVRGRSAQFCAAPRLVGPLKERSLLRSHPHLGGVRGARRSISQAPRHGVGRLRVSWSALDRPLTRVHFLLGQSGPKSDVRCVLEDRPIATWPLARRPTAPTHKWSNTAGLCSPFMAPLQPLRFSRSSAKTLEAVLRTQGLDLAA